MNITTELQDIKREGNRSWRRLGKVLNEVKLTGAWTKESKSLRSWIDNISKDLCVSSSGLRRAMYMVQYHETLRSDLSNQGISVESLDNLPSSVSAESLEILKRLSRYLPKKEFNKMAQDVLAGEVTRTQLQTHWRIVRDEKNSSSKGLRRGDIMSRFIKKGKEWLGNPKPKHYALFTDVTLEIRTLKLRFDFIVVEARPGGIRSLHAILVPDDMSIEETQARLEAMTCCAHYSWVLAANPTDMKSVGLIEVGSLSVKRNAARRSTPPFALDLALEVSHRNRAR